MKPPAARHRDDQRRSRSAWRLVLALVIGAMMSTDRAAAQGTTAGVTHDMGMNLDRVIRTFLLADLLEYAPDASGNPVRLDALGWVGGDYNRLYARVEGERTTVERSDDWRADVTYGRLVSPFWTAIAGGSIDTRLNAGQRRTRPLLVLGFEGMSPYFFEVEPMLYVSQHGDISARFTSSFDVLFTQRLIVQPRIEFNAAVQRVPEYGIGSGLNDVALGARMRYEWRREVAPYAGVEWVRRTGGTAGFARPAGEPVNTATFVAGIRLWR